MENANKPTVLYDEQNKLLDFLLNLATFLTAGGLVWLGNKRVSLLHMFTRANLTVLTNLAVLAAGLLISFGGRYLCEKGLTRLLTGQICRKRDNCTVWFRRTEWLTVNWLPAVIMLAAFLTASRFCGCPLFWMVWIPFAMTAASCAGNAYFTLRILTAGRVWIAQQGDQLRLFPRAKGELRPKPAETETTPEPAGRRYKPKADKP